MNVAHEVAQQWAGMLVGNDVVEEPWADEALAQHLALLAVEWAQGKSAANRLRERYLKQAFQSYRLIGGADGPVRRPCTGFADAFEFSAIVHSKGPLLFDAQRARVGAMTWEQALRRYFTEFRHQVAAGDAFEAVLEAEAPKDASRLGQQRTHWWDESHGDEDIGVAAMSPDAAQLMNLFRGQFP
jgi:aminopeptidase N